MVHIDQQQRNVATGPYCEPPLLLQNLIQTSTVGDFSEAVKTGEALDQPERFFEIFFRSLAARDVPHDVNEAKRLAGCRIVIKAQVRLHPQIAAILLSTPILKNLSYLSKSAVFQQSFPFVEIIGVNEFTVAAPQQFPRLPTQ